MKEAPKRLHSQAAEIKKILGDLATSKSLWQIWADFIEAAATSIANAVAPDGPQRQAREKRYLQIMQGYSKPERLQFPRLLALVADALEEDPDQDLLGQIYMELELGNHWKGQFFTPYCLCRCMAQITHEDLDSQIAENGYIPINDPACGAGATLVAARNAFRQQGLDWSSCALFIGQDIDRVAAMMCYIQLSLLGCAGYIVVADTLSNPICGDMLLPSPNEGQEVWIMPTMMVSPIWQMRIAIDRIKRLQPAAKAPAPVEKPVECVENMEQISLF